MNLYEKIISNLLSTAILLGEKKCNNYHSLYDSQLVFLMVFYHIIMNDNITGVVRF